MTCAARIRPFPNSVEIACDQDEHDHPPMHRGALRDYAYPDSITVIEWADNDRRTFYDKWPGDCPGCTLPLNHTGRHAP